ncbi:Major facilitator superfamily transporter [Colletotrichum higginsianum IMI 349063]|uniref:Major facilitator superfamily transporter n=1 Tax=Colletotrichum higginsianum (strain IMI 349063) TaxID=759273 RepID=A0A1B7YQF2_COLHI|nr:Major facilitator superfamily transporter [Colletotrichum higginsianum IMI 349063]OBR14276.1 Major facilitator superfamily transporter [Colletotrichum higginsianum IMI 349063]
MASAPPHSSSSSITATEADVEAQKPVNKANYFHLLFDQAGVTEAVLERKYPGEGTHEAPYVVDFLPEDAHNPQTFPVWKKWTYTIEQAIATLAVAFVSTAYSGGIAEVIRDFGVSTEIGILGVSLFVVGFAVGPLMWAPLSELYGRQYLFIVTYIALTAFNAGAAGAQNIETLIILRFFAGTFGASPMTNAGGVIADMFNANERGLATAIFAAAPFLGPSIGPIYGPAIRKRCKFAAEASAVLERMRQTHEETTEDDALAEQEKKEHERTMSAAPSDGGVLSDDERTVQGVISDDEAARKVQQA